MFGFLSSGRHPSKPASSPRSQAKGHVRVEVRSRRGVAYVQVPIHYDLVLTGETGREQSYATLVHELAHLYCGHLGTPDCRWWPDRRGCSRLVAEFEAETITHLVCRRAGIDAGSDGYLWSYLRDKKNGEVPRISIERVMAVAGLIERMGREHLKPHKQGSGDKVG